MGRLDGAVGGAPTGGRWSGAAGDSLAAKVNESWCREMGDGYRVSGDRRGELGVGQIEAAPHTAFLRRSVLGHAGTDATSGVRDGRIGEE